MSNNNQYENDVPKHRKSKESNTSKSRRKSKHKHQYKDCLIQYRLKFLSEDTVHITLGSYCTVCGKIGKILKDGVAKELDDRRLLNGIGYLSSIFLQEDLYEKFHDRLPLFHVEDIWEDYVDLEELNG